MGLGRCCYIKESLDLWAQIWCSMGEELLLPIDLMASSWFWTFMGEFWSPSDFSANCIWITIAICTCWPWAFTHSLVHGPNPLYATWSYRLQSSYNHHCRKSQWIPYGIWRTHWLPSGLDRLGVTCTAHCVFQAIANGLSRFAPGDGSLRPEIYADVGLASGQYAQDTMLYSPGPFGPSSSSCHCPQHTRMDAFSHVAAFCSSPGLQALLTVSCDTLSFNMTLW